MLYQAPRCVVGSHLFLLIIGDLAETVNGWLMGPLDRLSQRFAVHDVLKRTRSTHVFCLAAGFAMTGSILLAAHLTSGSAAKMLARKAIGSDDATASEAIAALERLGPRGEAAVSVLAEAFPALPKPRQVRLVGLIAHLGPQGMTFTAKLLQAHEHNEELAFAAADALGTLGKEGVHYLYPFLSPKSEKDLRLRAKVLETLLKMGQEAMPGLLDAVSPQTAAEVFPVIEKIDPYWYKHKSENEHFQTLLVCRKEGRNLHNEKLAEFRLTIIERLANYGPLAVSAAEDIAKLLTTTKQSDICIAGLQAIGKIGPGAAPYTEEVLSTLLDHPNADVRRQVLAAVNVLGPKLDLKKSLLPQLVRKLLADPDSQTRDCVLRPLNDNPNLGGWHRSERTKKALSDVLVP